MNVDIAILALCRALEKDLYIGKNNEDSHWADATRYCMNGMSRQVDFRFVLIGFLKKLGVRAQS